MYCKINVIQGVQNEAEDEEKDERNYACNVGVGCFTIHASTL
jgi:hypothetical protein